MSAPNLSAWLTKTRSTSSDERYEHLLLKEDPTTRVTSMDEVKAYVQAAHEDARNHFRKMLDLPTLDPLEEDRVDVTVFYPGWFHPNTLKGYFGEVMASLAATHHLPFGVSWQIPLHLFRYHNTALEKIMSLQYTISDTPGTTRPQVPGRTGDDCLAFEVDDQHKIIKVLCSEAKCTSSHDANLIKKAHEKLPNAQPTGIWQLKEALKDYPDKEEWIDALTELGMLINKQTAQYERVDHVVYVCGDKPKNGGTWMSPKTPHSSYTAGRRLSVAEIYLCDVDDIINYVYEAGRPVRRPSTIASAAAVGL